MPEDTVIASAPAAIAVAGATTDIGGKGGTFTLAVEGPEQTGSVGLRAYAKVTRTQGTAATTLRVENTDQVTADTLYGAGRLMEIAGYGSRSGVEISLSTSIPPKLGLGGAASQLAALLYALDALESRTRVPEELAEMVQRATLRPNQAHGYQKPYGAVFGGARYYGFSRKLTGLWGRGEGDVYDEPYATVSEARDEQWHNLGASLLVAVPRDLELVSGEINATIARQYRDEDPSTVEAMDRKAFTAQLAHQRLANGDRRGFWTLVDADTRIMDEWGLVTQAHKRIMAVAKEHGAYAAKPSSTGGAVIVFCPEGLRGMAEAIDGVTEEVYPARLAEGVRIEQSWPLER
jgi:galactokinase/mevalonate kinase-like predicted kinase